MQEIREFVIDKIKYDSVPRVKHYSEALYNDLFRNGLRRPLEVEGPDSLGFVYLKDGYLRGEAIKRIRDKHPERFKTIKCLVVNKEITTPLERNLERLGDAFYSSKMTGFEKQRYIENAINEGISERDLAKRFNVTVSVIRRIRKGESVPEGLRMEIAMLKGSQEALRTIYHLDTSQEFVDNMLDRLREGELKTIHATSIKRVISAEWYERLDNVGKESVILKTIEQTEFTKEAASLINLNEVVKRDPTENKDLIHPWIIYLCEEIEAINEMIPNDISEHVNSIQKRRLKNATFKFLDRIKWVYGERTSFGGMMYRFKMKEKNDDIL
ncbi:hypothetical protein QA612_20250 [Evansella sp. AB-P1]|uniref:hypothetical protein n=1 Tax=Evansella sp. AB-P1 TaxID=3037653 RepID=UPI0024203854|nr:hypothetical protein [Evansella sp. AB-P1]MDG5789793.1 hypothetical protein [Evansella sp. AB-P1]